MSKTAVTAINPADVTLAHNEPAAAEPVEMRKRIGSTDYVVTVYFSKTSKETIEDKLRRLIVEEVKDIA